MTVLAAPPATRVENVVETLHGVKVDDPYRWLEAADEGEVKSWTEKQNAHMRQALDGVPGRKWIQERLWQTHEIGALGVPVVKGIKAPAGKRRYFYTRRTGKQNQPVLYVRDGKDGAIDGEDRVVVDVNTLSKDGTRALDWWFPSENGRYVAYGVSANGDEESVLHVHDVQTGKDLADTITRTRFASVAWRPDHKSFYYTRYPLPGTVPAGEEKYHRHVYFHRLGSDPAQDPKIFGDGRDLKDWPSVTLSPDGRWLAIEVSQGWAKSEVYLLDAKAKTKTTPAKPVTVVEGKPALYRVARGAERSLLPGQQRGGAPVPGVRGRREAAPARRLERGHSPERGDAGGDLGGGRQEDAGGAVSEGRVVARAPVRHRGQAGG